MREKGQLSTNTPESVAAVGRLDTTQDRAGLRLRMCHLMPRRSNQAERFDVSESFCLFSATPFQARGVGRPMSVLNKGARSFHEGPTEHADRVP